ncbi:restriction endonuclease subunit S [Leuconostoc lactis]|uniref:restriction endonuclease subunit S n=1 Tax=Leuconostoc lactis TaxID=1246 RepID=UPI001D12A97B|nr:restriction endonuclease subunit S [Leuconostoc lactis]MCC2745084.1 restriction endonuclease subunit S [Leuconostoc lactis]MCC2755621.1 restriction endonuclease subunit S [Leuconostoc lactis]
MSEMVPKIRFQGFTDAWEQRKLSDLADHRGGTAIEKYFEKDGKYKVISIGSYGLDSKYVDQNIRAVSNEVTDGRVVRAGELTMVLNDKTANGTIIGRTLLIEQDNEYVINQRTEIISPKENFNADFAYTLLNGPFREKVKRIVQGGTQIYVNYPAVSNLDVGIPNIQEQQKIGSFFKQLDNIITLHQRKLDLLKEQKRGFLKKMFPKEGELVPEVRFSGFTDNWKESILEHIVSINSGRDYKHLKNGDIPVYGTGGYMLSVNEALSEKDAIGIGRKGTINRPYILRSPFWTVDTLFFAIPKQENDLYFLNAVFQKVNWQKYDESTGVPSLSKAVINKVAVTVPRTEEQQKIGNYFMKLDDFISLLQNKIDLLNEQKKGFLNKMFTHNFFG